jgi:hypothetical protein
MASVLTRLGLPLILVAIACGESPSTSENDQGAATGATSGVSTSGTSSGGANTSGANTGGANPGGATTGGVGQPTGGANAGGAGSGAIPGGSSSGGADPGGASPGGASSGGAAGTGMSGAPPGGMGGVGGATGTGGLAGAPVGGAGSGDAYATGVMVTVHPDIRTMLNVTWTQAMAADQVYLEFTFEAGNVMTSRAKPGAVGMKRDVVIGVPAATAVTVRVVSRAGGVDYKTRDYMGTTGALPSGLPVGQVLMYNAAIASPNRWMFGAVENSTGGCNSTQCFYHTTFWLYIMDRQGRMVWYYSDAASNATSSFQRMARDGEYIWIEKRPFGGNSARSVLKRTLDGTYSENIPISGLADCIDVTSDGSLLYDANNVLRERTRAGQTRDIFNCRNHWSSGSCYTNTVNWNSRDNTVLMSYPERDTVLEVSRTTANTVVGQYGMASGSYSFATTPPPPPPETTWQFGYNHFANISKDGTLMVSSHLNAEQATNQPVAGQHAFMEFTIDRTNRRLTNAWYYNGGQEWAMYKGMVIKLANNNYLANYGTGGVIREITPDKQTAFLVKFDAPAGSSGTDFYNKMVGHNELINDLYALNGGGPPMQ